MNKTILLVEDDMFVRELYLRVLAQTGYAIVAAVDGEDGIQKAQQVKPDLVLLDIMMPKVNGLDVLLALKAKGETKHIPVVLLTNLGHAETIQDAFAAGAQGYLMKVRISPYEIIDTVEKFIKDPTYKMDIKQMEMD